MPNPTDPTTILSRLEATIAARRAGASVSGPESSYVARLHAKGRGKIAQKVGEEATEVVIAALTGAPEALVGEAADLLFHLLVLIGDCGVSLADVTAELERREGISGIAEKASRSS
ncbi:phosphoribosyl-ATP pyrophosphatase [Novosphingobium fuchskuhlense]|uniref:Phosphoribosyl-ATP pyrophosphatase n=2 Tax=Novosphingobium fuchskuhlense TaxID=1117702 RepID=A0A117UTK0_9SPHN|nr:phosphoribosyl-ATP pyrophosphatase [Novosphingobium fuchskuhlense]